MRQKFVLIVACCLLSLLSQSQSIVYSQPDRNDVRNLEFDIVGRLNNHYLIFKNNHNIYTVAVYDDDMKQVASEKLDFLPERTINTDILAYRNYFYLFYQYQKRNIVYCMAAKLDGDGKLIGEKPMQLDTTQINIFTSNKVYSLVYSEDKQKVGFIKINTREQTSNQVTCVLFDNELNLIKKSVANIDMPERSNFLAEFNIDNNGDFVFVRANGSSQKDNISDITLVTQKKEDNDLTLHPVSSAKVYLDDIRLKVDNINNNYLLASFYSKSKRGNVDGLYTSLYSKGADSIVTTAYNAFDENLRSEAKNEGNSKYAFNDFFLQNIVMRRDGGYVVAAESVYSSTRGNQYNRWDYLNNYYGGYGSFLFYSPLSYYGSYGYGYYPWYRSGFGYQNTRYFADNIALLSFDSSAQMSWSNVIHKAQFDDNTDDFIGYITMNTGSEVHFLYNQTERKNVLLSDQTVTPGGKLSQTPTLKNLDRGYEFMPRLGKQVGAKQMIIPCTYRNYICFAKVDFQ